METLGGMTEGLTLEYRLKTAETTVTVVGAIDAPDCATLREGLDFARSLRPSGPIVVDLGGVDSLALAALVILDRAAADARRAGRVLSVRNLHQENITDPASLAVLENTS
jgi:anti-anti-sigma regulatory factor